MVTILKRRTIRLTLLTAGILLSGCAVGSPKLPQSISPTSVVYTTVQLEKHRCLYEEAVTGKPCQTVGNNATTSPTRDLTLAKYWRDTMIGLIRRDIESFYGEYEKQLADSRRRFGSVVDVTSLAGVAATTITNGARAKTVISTMVAFVEGAHGKIDQNLFRERTTDAIIQKMRAGRARIDALVLRKMDLDATQYTFSAAERDLREFFRAGTLQSGFLELAASAGVDAAQSTEERNRVEERRLLPIATRAQRDLSKKIGDKVAELEKLWLDNQSNAVGKAALQAVLDALNNLKTQSLSADAASIPANTSDPQKLFSLLRAEMADAALSPPERLEKKLAALAQALGIS